MGTMTRLSRNPVTPRNPPTLFLTMLQTFSVRVGRYRSRFGIIFSARASSCWRSAELTLVGAAEIASTAAALGSGGGLGPAAAVGVGDGGRGGGVPSKRLTKLDDADLPRPVVPPKNRLYSTIRSTMRSRAFWV